MIILDRSRRCIIMQNTDSDTLKAFGLWRLMGRLSVSKYKTGLYYKACLYSGSPEWIVGCVEPPATCSYLVAAICINKAILKIDIAADGENPDIINQSLIQTESDLKSLGFRI